MYQFNIGIPTYLQPDTALYMGFLPQKPTVSLTENKKMALKKEKITNKGPLNLKKKEIQKAFIKRGRA